MRIRTAKYEVTSRDVKKIKMWCRETDNIEIIVKLANEVCPVISIPLSKSLIFGESYETLYQENPILYQKGDFYAYRRKLIYKIGLVMNLL